MGSKKDNVFVRAKAYRKLHPRMSFQDAIQKVSGKRKPVTKKAAPKKRAVVGKRPAIKRVVIKVGKARKPAVSHTSVHRIGSVAALEHTRHRNNLQRYENQLVALMSKKTAGMSAVEKRDHAKAKENTRKLISSTKAFMRDLKKVM